MNAGDVRLQQTIDRFLEKIPAICRHLFSFILGLTAGRSSLGGLTPFPTALAVVIPFLPEGGSWTVLAGLLLGIFIRGDACSLMNSLADALAAVFAVFLAFRLERSSCDPPLAFFSVAAGCVDLLMKAALRLLTGEGSGFATGLLAEAALSGTFAVPFYYVLSDIPLERKELTRFLLFLFLVLSGLGGLRIGAVEIREVVVRILLLVTASVWGASWGAAAGVILGLLTGDPWQMLPRMGFYAGTGFCSGTLRGLGRAGVLIGFGLAVLLFSFFYETGVGLTGHLIAAGLAGTLYLFCSPFLGRLLGEGFQRPPAGSRQLQMETGFAQRAKPDEPLCGDSLATVLLDGQRFLLVVSDGMGTGINAGRESRIVTKMMEQLIASGNPPDVAAGIVNTALFLRGGEESAATIDLALVDLNLGIVDFLKAGAPPSFIKRDGCVEMVRSLCWPAGILDRLDPEVLRREILPGDLLVMVTDGVTEVEDEGTTPGGWLYGFLQEIPVEDPQIVADLILKQALKSSSRSRDDMTVLVARFFEDVKSG